VAAKGFQAADSAALERALLDVLRVGLSGDAAGVRQLARRLIRNTPEAVNDPGSFRQAVGEILTTVPAVTSIGFRTALADIPVDLESQQPLLAIRGDDTAPRPVLAARSADVIDEVIQERVHQAMLTTAGLTPTRTVLLSGPPGVGKTMTARFIASALGQHLLVMDLASLMSSFLGRTGQNLKAALAYAKTQPCVVLLDEFDALAKRRDDEADVGELKRLVNVLLLELERWPADNLLIAATNHPELLDRAVHRRFDRIVDLALPEFEQRIDILNLGVAASGATASTQVLEVCAELTSGLSGSDVDRLVSSAARRALLQSLSMDRCLVEAVIESAPDIAGGKRRDAFCGIARAVLGYSDRQIASMLGVSHPTVAKAIARWTSDQQAVG
jgi:hypothetical protein